MVGHQGTEGVSAVTLQLFPRDLWADRGVEGLGCFGDGSVASGSSVVAGDVAAVPSF